MLDAAFSSTFIYERQATLDEIKSDLADLVIFDRKATQQATLWGRIAGACGIALLIGAALGCCCGDFGLSGVGWAVLGVVLVPFIVTAYFFFHHNSLVLDKRRYEIAIALVRHVGRDVVPDRPVSLRMDFRRTQSKPFELTRHVAGALTFVEYKQPWLDFGGRLYDGTKVRLEIDQRVDRKETSKRKTTKIREVFQERMVLTLAGRPERRPSLKLAPQLVAQALARKMTLRSVRLEGNALRTTVCTSKQMRESLRGNTINPDAEKLLVTQDSLLLLFMACYRAWRLVRRPLPT